MRRLWLIAILSAVSAAAWTACSLDPEGLPPDQPSLSRDGSSLSPAMDGGGPDASADAGGADASLADASGADTGPSDAGSTDAETPDAEASDSGEPDAGSADAGADPRLTWWPPVLDNPTTIKITNATNVQILDNSRDYILLLPGAVGNDLQSAPLQASGGLAVKGGRNVHIIGGAIVHDIDYEPDCWTNCVGRGGLMRGMYLQHWMGTMFVEGVSIGGSKLYEGIDIFSQATSAPNAKLFLQNVRIESPLLSISTTGNDGVAFRTTAGPAGGLFIDKFTVFESTYGGLYLNPDQYGDPPARSVIKRFNIHAYTGTGEKPPPYAGPFGNGLWFFWQQTAFPLELQECYSKHNPAYSFGRTLYPDTTVSGGGCIVATDSRGTYAYWPPVRQINTACPGCPAFRQGTPPGGDFVPAGSVGVGYQNALGYQN